MSDRNLHDLIVKTGRSTEDVHTIGEIYSIIPLSVSFYYYKNLLFFTYYMYLKPCIYYVVLLLTIYLYPIPICIYWL